MDVSPASSLPTVIFITGHPASGKSSVAARLSTVFGWPVLAKDRIKERLLDTLPDVATTAIGPAAWELVYDTLDLVMQTGSSVLVDGNFWTREARPRLQDLVRKHGYRVLEISLAASRERLIHRYLMRLADPERPASHVRGVGDPSAYIAHAVAQPYEPLRLSADVLVLDTNDWNQLCWAAVLDWVQTRRSGREGGPTDNGEASRADDRR